MYSVEYHYYYNFQSMMLCNLFGMRDDRWVSRLQLFDRMKIENPTYRGQVRVVSGDFSQPNLGIDEVDVDTIRSKINVVIHLAATTTDNPTLHEAVCTNVRATRDLMVLTKRFQNLKVVASIFLPSPKLRDIHCFLGVSVFFSFYNRDS